ELKVASVGLVHVRVVYLVDDPVTQGEPKPATGVVGRPYPLFRARSPAGLHSRRTKGDWILREAHGLEPQTPSRTTPLWGEAITAFSQIKSSLTAFKRRQLPTGNLFCPAALLASRDGRMSIANTCRIAGGSAQTRQLSPLEPARMRS